MRSRNDIVDSHTLFRKKAVACRTGCIKVRILNRNLAHLVRVDERLLIGFNPEDWLFGSPYPIVQGQRVPYFVDEDT